eukprot:m.131077 g.131077  ORF g.131077 m.131077 type:complete len:311 (-) comp11304_c0_seq4:2052-2984(-)
MLRQPCTVGNIRHNILGKHEPLRSSKPSKRRIARQVGAARKPHTPDRRDVVHVVHMKQRTVHHGIGQVGRVARVGVELNVERRDASILLVAHLVAPQEGMPPTTGHHVDIAVQDTPHRTSELMRRHRRRRRDKRRAGLFAAKPASETLGTAHNATGRNAESTRDEHLRLVWVLRRSKDLHLTVFPFGHGQGPVGLKVKMLLATNAVLGFHHVVGGCKPGIEIAVLNRLPGTEVRRLGNGVFNGENDWQVFVLNRNRLGSFACYGPGCGYHNANNVSNARHLYVTRQPTPQAHASTRHYHTHAWSVRDARQ